MQHGVKCDASATDPRLQRLEWRAHFAKTRRMGNARGPWAVRHYPPHPMPADLRPLVTELRHRFLNQPFGTLFFWRYAVFRPHDQSYVVLDAAVDGDRLELTLRDARGAGGTSVLSVWSPQGLTIDATGLRLQAATRLKFDDVEARLDGTGYRLTTPRGEGRFATDGAPALTMDW